MSSKWYFAKDGTSHGPINLEDLRRDLNRGELPPDTLVWNDRMPNWQAAASLPEFRTSPPPIPPGSAPVILAEPPRPSRAPEPWSPEARPPAAKAKAKPAPTGFTSARPRAASARRFQPASTSSSPFLAGQAVRNTGISHCSTSSSA